MNVYLQTTGLKFLKKPGGKRTTALPPACPRKAARYQGYPSKMPAGCGTTGTPGTLPCRAPHLMPQGWKPPAPHRCHCLPGDKKPQPPTVHTTPHYYTQAGGMGNMPCTSHHPPRPIRLIKADAVDDCSPLKGRTPAWVYDLTVQAKASPKTRRAHWHGHCYLINPRT